MDTVHKDCLGLSLTTNAPAKRNFLIRRPNFNLSILAWEGLVSGQIKILLAIMERVSNSVYLSCYGLVTVSESSPAPSIGTSTLAAVIIQISVASFQNRP